jgi:hypothetical protein
MAWQQVLTMPEIGFETRYPRGQPCEVESICFVEDESLEGMLIAAPSSVVI